jgi:predicted ribosome quality control (RQC) complex YloA/Tae2 family protein
MMLPQVLSQPQMEILCQEIQQRLANTVIINCFALSDRQIVLQFHSDRSTFLFFSFQEPFLRFHFIHLTQQVQKLPHHPLHFFLIHSTFKQATMLNQDRILKLTFQQKAQPLFLIAEFFPRRSNCYLVDANEKILYSLHPISFIYYTLPPIHQKIVATSSLALTHQEVEEKYQQLESELKVQKTKKEIEKSLNRQLKRLLKREQTLQKALEDCLNWPLIQHEGELLKTYFSLLKRGLQKIQVWDWLEEKERVISLNPKRHPQEELHDRFRRSKKLHAGVSHLQNQLNTLTQQLEQTKKGLQILQAIYTEAELEEFKQQRSNVFRTQTFSKQKNSPPLPYVQYQSEAGLKIWVGRNASSNEQLTFHLARGSDWWLHVRDFPGSHVIIRVPKGKEPDSDTLADAIQLALYYSKAKSRGEGEVCITQKKFVTRFSKGQVGKVHLSKHKNLFVRLDPQRYKKLKDRQQESLNLHL